MNASKVRQHPPTCQAVAQSLKTSHASATDSRSVALASMNSVVLGFLNNHPSCTSRPGNTTSSSFGQWCCLIIFCSVLWVYSDISADKFVRYTLPTYQSRNKSLWSSKAIFINASSGCCRNILSKGRLFSRASSLAASKLIL